MLFFFAHQFISWNSMIKKVMSKTKIFIKVSMTYKLFFFYFCSSLVFGTPLYGINVWGLLAYYRYPIGLVRTFVYELHVLNFFFCVSLSQVSYISRYIIISIYLLSICIFDALLSSNRKVVKSARLWEIARPSLLTLAQQTRFNVISILLITRLSR